MVIRWYLIPLVADIDPNKPPMAHSDANGPGRRTFIRLNQNWCLMRCVTTPGEHLVTQAKSAVRALPRFGRPVSDCSAFIRARFADVVSFTNVEMIETVLLRLVTTRNRSIKALSDLRSSFDAAVPEE